MERQEDETMSSFNKRFASFYYNIPKQIQPLEDVSKIYYASTFPPKLSHASFGKKASYFAANVH